MLADQAHALLGCLRGDEHDEAQPVPGGHVLVTLHIVLEGQVRDDHPVHAHARAAGAERLEAIAENGVQVAHQDEGNVHVAADVLELGEEFFEGHPVPEGLRGGVLDHGPVGHRIAEGDADFDHVHAFACQGADDVRRTVGGGGPGAEIDGEQALRAGAEKIVYPVHFLIVASFLKRLLSGPGL